MSRSWKIILILALFILGLFLVLRFTVSGQVRLFDDTVRWFKENVLMESPTGIRTIKYTSAEIKAMEEHFRDGSELWRSDGVAVVRHEQKRLGIPSGAEVREHGEYRTRPDNVRETIIIAIVGGEEMASQTAVRIEEHKPGFWVPVAVGPFSALLR